MRKERGPKSEVKEGFIQVIGGRVYYKVIGPESQRSPLLVLHGGSGARHDSMAALEELAGDRRIIFYDQLGSGRSDKPKNRKDLWVLDRFDDELERVKEGLGLSKYILFGQSWGAFLAAYNAIHHKNGLQALILSGPLLSVPLWIVDANRLKSQLPTASQEAIDRNETAGTTDTQEYKEAATEFYKRHFCQIYPYPKEIAESLKATNLEVYNTMWGPSEFRCAGNLQGQDLTGRLSEIDVAVLLNYGRFDEATPETVAYFKTLFKREAEMAVFEKSAHVPYIEEPEAFVKRIGDFLRRNDGA